MLRKMSMVILLLFASMTLLSSPTFFVNASTVVGMHPWGVAFNPFNGNMYVTNFDSNTTSVLHGRSVVAIIPVGHHPEGVAFDPVNNAMYVANSLDGTVSVIDSASNTVSVTIDSSAHNCPPSTPFGLAFDPTVNDMLVSSLTCPINAISSSSNTLVGQSCCGGCCVGEGIAVDTAHHQIYLAGGSSNSIHVFDSAANGGAFFATGTIPVGVNPTWVAADPANGNMYVTNSGSGTVSVINTTSNSVIHTIGVGASPFGIAFNPRNGDVYVANSGSNFVSVIDGSTNTVIAVITVGTGPLGVAFDPANKHIYVAVSGLNEIVQIRGLKVGH